MRAFQKSLVDVEREYGVRMLNIRRAVNNLLLGGAKCINCNREDADKFCPGCGSRQPEIVDLVSDSEDKPPPKKKKTKKRRRLVPRSESDDSDSDDDELLSLISAAKPVKAEKPAARKKQRVQNKDEPDTIVVKASTPTVPPPASDNEERVPWTVDPAVLTKIDTFQVRVLPRPT